MTSLLSHHCCRGLLRAKYLTKTPLTIKPAASTRIYKNLYSTHNTNPHTTSTKSPQPHIHTHNCGHLHDHKLLPLQCWSCTKFVDKEELFCKSCNVIQQPETPDDLFRLFKMPRQFGIDLLHLADRFKKLQRKLHPDLFALKSQTEKSFSENQSSSLNHAYNVLKTPHLRAEYLLRLHGIDVGETMGTVTDSGMLMHIMDLREAVDEGDDASLKVLGEDNRKNIDLMVDELGVLFDSHDLEKAKSKTIELKYLEKIQEEIVHKLGIHL